MRHNRYVIGAAVAGLAAAIASAGVHGQSASPSPAPAAGSAAGAAAPAPNWAPVTDPDALIELNDQKTYSVTYSLDQRGCAPSAKVYGNEPIAVDGYKYGGCLVRG